MSSFKQQPVPGRNYHQQLDSLFNSNLCLHSGTPKAPTSSGYNPPHPNPIMKGQQIAGRTHDITSQNRKIDNRIQR